MGAGGSPGETVSGNLVMGKPFRGNIVPGNPFRGNLFRKTRFGEPNKQNAKTNKTHAGTGQGLTKTKTKTISK